MVTIIITAFVTGFMVCAALIVFLFWYCVVRPPYPGDSFPPDSSLPLPSNLLDDADWDDADWGMFDPDEPYAQIARAYYDGPLSDSVDSKG